MISVREYKEKDLNEMIRIWNQVVDEGIAFPQEDQLNDKTGESFFREQTFTGVAIDDNDNIVGLYILHPNNVGRCGHIANASYAVDEGVRGQHIGESLVKHSIEMAGQNGFKILQFNAVVESNTHARHLYERMGFKQLGTIPGGFRMKDGTYANICPYFTEI